MAALTQFSSRSQRLEERRRRCAATADEATWPNQARIYVPHQTVSARSSPAYASSRRRRATIHAHRGPTERRLSAPGTERSNRCPAAGSPSVGEQCRRSRDPVSRACLTKTFDGRSEDPETIRRSRAAQRENAAPLAARTRPRTGVDACSRTVRTMIGTSSHQGLRTEQDTGTVPSRSASHLRRSRRMYHAPTPGVP